MRNKIIEHFKNNYDSSPHEITNEEIKFLIKNNCKRDCCGASIFDLDDFPEIDIEGDELLCEDCYSEKYRETCPICEESYDTKDFVNDYFVLTEEGAKETKLQPGIYKIIERPYFYGNIVSGFDAFFPNSIELVVSIKINEYKRIRCGDGCCEVISDEICPDCADKYIRKKDFLLVDGLPCLLVKRYENDLFKEYTPDRLHKERQKLIHERITCRGLIEKGNHKLIKERYEDKN